MSLPGPSSHQVRFGDFEVDLETGELFWKGRKFTLQGQPFQVLAILLERPGQLVTREELKAKLWPADTFVDFDHSLNKAVNRLREALMDAAEHPRFIETLPRRGYRWIGPACQKVTIPAESAVPVQMSAAADDWSKAGHSRFSPDALLEIRHRLGQIWMPAFLALGLIGGVVFLLQRSTLPPRVLNIVQITHDRVPKLGLVTDGARVYINETLGMKQILVQVSETGGEISVVPTPFANISLYDISPDHSRILAGDTVGPALGVGAPTADVPLWAMPLAAGIPQRVGDLTGHFAIWSPDGRQLVFAKGFDIYAANTDGSNIRRLSTVSGFATWLRFSPDGTRIRFTLIDTKNNSVSIWEINADGSNLHPLLHGWHSPIGADAASGTWSPDGRYYFFVSSASGVPCVWVLPEHPGLFHTSRAVPVQLTTGPMFFGPFVPSPDGKKLLADGWLLRGELVRYNKTSRQFEQFFSDTSITDLDFSRDGQRVAYVTWPEHTLWRSRIDGSERLQLTSASVTPSQPRWSPDGSQIAYVDTQGGHPYKLFVMSADGGIPRELLSETRQQMDASWSPDGRKIVFGRVPSLREPAEKMAIQIIDLGSKEVSSIPESGNLYAPRWSPDGRYLAALTADSRRLMLYDFTIQKWGDWVDGAGAISSPSWSGDGKYIYYDSSSKNALAYRRTKIGQKRSELVVDLNNLRRLGPWSGLAPDGSPLFIRDVSSDDIYALDLKLP
jgi:Tol biopolymer transport system component/DNA-binding winged helix-turn-helix (wHTH) protein